MKYNLDSFDISALVIEIRKRMVGLRLQKVYDVTKKMFCLKFQEKVLLFIESGIQFHYNDKKEFNATRVQPTGFCMKLRKHLKNKRLESVRQIYFDRVVEWAFGSDDYRCYIITEMYGSGNIVLTDKDYKVLIVLHRSDIVKVGAIYPFDQTTHPIPKINLSAAGTLSTESTLTESTGTGGTETKSTETGGTETGGTGEETGGTGTGGTEGEIEGTETGGTEIGGTEGEIGGTEIGGTEIGGTETGIGEGNLSTSVEESLPVDRMLENLTSGDIKRTLGATYGHSLISHLFLIHEEDVTLIQESLSQITDNLDQTGSENDENKIAKGYIICNEKGEANSFSPMLYIQDQEKLRKEKSTFNEAISEFFGGKVDLKPPIKDKNKKAEEKGKKWANRKNENIGNQVKKIEKKLEKG